MQLVYINHSAFYIESEKAKIVIDYYNDTASIINDDFFDGKKVYFLASHVHLDHFERSIFSFDKSQIKYILSNDIKVLRKDARDRDITFIGENEIYKDDILEIKTFASTDEGVSFFIKIDNKTIFHAGDLNNWHWKDEFSEEESKEAEKDYETELNKIAKEINYLDLLIFPIDPRLVRDIDLGAKQFVENIKVKNLAPMHFWDNYDIVNSFKDYYQSRGINFLSIKNKGDKFNF